LAEQIAGSSSSVVMTFAEGAKALFCTLDGLEKQKRFLGTGFGIAVIVVAILSLVNPAMWAFLFPTQVCAAHTAATTVAVPHSHPRTAAAARSPRYPRSPPA